jgi:hypothetical protein
MDAIKVMTIYYLISKKKRRARLGKDVNHDVYSIDTDVKDLNKNSNCDTVNTAYVENLLNRDTLGHGVNHHVDSEARKSFEDYSGEEIEK